MAVVEREESLAKVVSYLKELGLSEEVIATFKKEKMDETAVIHADDVILKKLGVMYDGDLIRLRILCSNGRDSMNDRKKELKNIIAAGPETRLKKSGSPPKQMKLAVRKSRMIYVSWKFYDKKLKRFALVKADKGGGLCKLTIHLDVGKDEFLKQCIDHFWLRKKGIAVGKNKTDFHFYLTDGKDDPINDTITLNGNEKVPFTIGNFCNENKLMRPRVFLYTKLKSIIDRMVFSSDDEVEVVYSTPRRVSQRNSSTPVANTNHNIESPNGTDQSNDHSPALSAPNRHYVSHSLPSSIITSSQLIGTTQERSELTNEMDDAYNASLQVDRQKDLENQEKENQEKIKEENEDRLKLLMMRREEKLSAEPDLSEDHIVVAIRHPILGHKSRLFGAGTKMIETYWWTGSLHTTPEFFELIDYNGKTIYPDQNASPGIYNVKPIECSINMSLDGEVGFDEFNAINVTKSSNALSSYHSLIDLQHSEKDNLKLPRRILSINRENVFEDMLKGFDNDIYDGGKVAVVFENENAVGEGVSRDGFTCFFQAVYEKFEGENEKVPPADMEVTELETIGRIMTHAFIEYNVFPVKLCKAMLCQHIYGSISNQELLQSFLNYLPSREKERVDQFAKGLSKDIQPIMDILSESRIFISPTKDNIFDLCTKAATMTLIRFPYISSQALVKGMGDFWKSVSSDMLTSMYKCTDATAERIIEAMDVQETCAQDGKVTTYLHRYLRSCLEHEIHAFMRFVTGSTSLIPRDVIKVQYVHQTHNYLCPRAETCFKVLTLPRGYTSFTHMRDNLRKYLRDELLWSIQDDNLTDSEDQ